MATTSRSLVPCTLGVPAARELCLPGDTFSFSRCGDTVDPSCVTGELLTAVADTLHCVCLLNAGETHSPNTVRWTRAAPASTPRCPELSCCLSLRKDTSREALGTGAVPALAVIFGHQISGAGLERFGSNSGCILFISQRGCFEKPPVLWLAF